MGVYLKKSETCRLCCGTQLELVIKLTPTPPANAFVEEKLLEDKQDCFPLDVYQCLHCGHVQLLDILDPNELFSNYVYVSGTSPVFVKHFENYAKKIISDYKIGAGSLIVEVGSNDGTLLKFFQEAGMSVLGIDPAANIARQATKAGIDTLPEFFSIDLAKKIRKERGAAALVVANNVFAHTDDLRGFAEGVRVLLADAGLFVFEVSYLVDVFRKTLFDTIYHEHLSYHSLVPLIPFFNSLDMDIVDAQRIDTHGGSLRVFVQKTHGPWAKVNSVTNLCNLESDMGLDQPHTLRRFSSRVDHIRQELITLLRDLKRQGKRLAGYGAPAKATTLMYHFGLDREILEYIIDDSPLKQNLYSPGLHIPVMPFTHLSNERPDFLLILAWNFASPIIEKNREFSEHGGKFLIPLPEVVII